MIFYSRSVKGYLIEKEGKKLIYYLKNTFSSVILKIILRVK